MPPRRTPSRGLFVAALGQTIGAAGSGGRTGFRVASIDSESELHEQTSTGMKISAATIAVMMPSTGMPEHRSMIAVK